MLNLLRLRAPSACRLAASVVVGATIAHCATAATLSHVAIRSCLAGRSIATDVYVTELPADAVYTEPAYRPGYDAVYLLHWNGGDVGLARRDAGDALVAVGTLFPLSEARRLKDSGPPQRFDPHLARWLSVKQGGNRYLCVSFSFSGLGQSGRFQQVRGGYLLPLQPLQPNQSLYYVVADVSRDLDE
jgi:hypothetical protein